MCIIKVRFHSDVFERLKVRGHPGVLGKLDVIHVSSEG